MGGGGRRREKAPAPEQRELGLVPEQREQQGGLVADLTNLPVHVCVCMQLSDSTDMQDAHCIHTMAHSVYPTSSSIHSHLLQPLLPLWHARIHATIVRARSGTQGRALAAPRCWCSLKEISFLSVLERSTRCLRGPLRRCHAGTANGPPSPLRRPYYTFSFLLIF